MSSDVLEGLVDDVVFALCMECWVAGIKERGDSVRSLQFSEYVGARYSQSASSVLNTENHEFCCTLLFVHNRPLFYIDATKIRIIFESRIVSGAFFRIY